MAGDVDTEMFMSLVAGIVMDQDRWRVNSVFLDLARDVCRRSAWPTRPEPLVATRLFLRVLNDRLAIEPGLRYFITVLECRLPATELLAWSTKVSGS